MRTAEVPHGYGVISTSRHTGSQECYGNVCILVEYSVRAAIFLSILHISGHVRFIRHPKLLF